MRVDGKLHSSSKMITNKNVITIGLSLAFIVAISTIPLAKAINYDFAIPRYSVYDCIPPTPTSFLCGNYLGQHSPENLTGDNTRSNSVFIEIDPQYQNNGGVEVPIIPPILCSLDNAVPATCPQPTAYTNLAIGQHTFKAILVTSFGNDPNPPVFTWNIIATTPPPIPPDTTITSAVDGNGATIQNGGTTVSTSIHFTFTATAGTNPIASFECSLDNSAFSSCSSPATLTNLAAGKHTIQVRAVDTAGNKDPTPATFGWTVSPATPTQSIQQLIQLKHSMHLDPLTDGMLDIRLNIALQFSQNNVKSGTCLQLNVFISQVQSSFRVGHMTSAQASQLIQRAQNIQTALGCSVATSANVIGQLSASTSPPSLNLTRNQQPPQTTASSPPLLQPQSQSHPYTNQYRYPSQHPYLFQIPRSQLPQNQQPRFNPPTVK
jgi:hypothetical protein